MFYTTLNFFLYSNHARSLFHIFSFEFFFGPFLHSIQLLLRKVVKLEKEIVAKMKRKKTCSYSCFDYWILLFFVDKWIKGLFGNNLLGFVRNENTEKRQIERRTRSFNAMTEEICQRKEKNHISMESLLFLWVFLYSFYGIDIVWCCENEYRK